MATIIIPAYNEEPNIEKVLISIPKKYKVMVVDDGSRDRTAEIVENLGYKCIRLSENKGKGYACRIGAEHADSEIVFMDADAQFSSDDIPKFIEALNSYDIVIGERIAGIPIQRRISNKFAIRFVNKISGQKLNDVLCGFRAIRKKKFFELELERDGYEFESEMIIKASRAGLKIGTVPVKVQYNEVRGMTVRKSIGLAFYLIKQRVKTI